MAVHYSRVSSEEILALAGIRTDAQKRRHMGYIMAFDAATRRTGSPMGRGRITCKNCHCKVRSVGHDEGPQHVGLVRSTSKNRASKV